MSWELLYLLSTAIINKEEHKEKKVKITSTIAASVPTNESIILNELFKNATNKDTDNPNPNKLPIKVIFLVVNLIELLPLV
jgi:hypothetical protein